MVRVPRRSSDASDHRTAWAALDFRDRRRILKAVNRGQAVEDRREARLAVGAARHQKRFWKKAWLLGPVLSLFALTSGAAAYAVNAVFATSVLGLMALFWYRRADRAEHANEELAQGPKRAPRQRSTPATTTHTPHRPSGARGGRPDPNTSKKKLARRKRR